MYLKIRYIFCIAACVWLAACSFSIPDKPRLKKDIEKERPAIRLTLIPSEPLIVGKKNKILVKLLNLKTFRAITLDDLAIIGGHQIQLLMVDSGYRDFRHIVPQETDAPGIFSFTFTAKHADGYRAWAYVKPKILNKEQYASANLGRPRGGNMSKQESLTTAIDRHNFTLSFDTTPTEKTLTTSHIRITNKKGDLKLGNSTARIVAFSDDFRTVTYIGKQSPSPDISFQFTPPKSGFMKIFVQTEIKGKPLTIPFGIIVKPADS